ncbi:TolC family protein [Hymenobacter ginkgonis]|uniref:TolC family protein n=1 Tax=Hymenobacter ginkgonis TaxID=2682976 RepID=UPI0018DC6ACA|nr:TolC family protein [Hymenobacter ginkgonis]
MLPRLYEAAIAHSGEIERLDATRDVANVDVKLAKKRSLNMLAVTTSYNYGTLPYFATAETSSTPTYQVNPFNLGARAQYSTGFNVVAPFDVLFGRRATIQRQELVLNQVAGQRKAKESEIRQTVILQYQQLTLAKAMLQHYQDALQSASISRKIADKRFKEGEIQVDEQMAAMDFYGKALLAHEEALNKYQTSQLLLEDLIGMPINNLMLGK